MKLVCISDTHGFHDQLSLPRGDILVHAGDFTDGGLVEEAQHFLRWFGQVGDFAHRLLIAGNHDLAFEHLPELVEKFIPENVTYLNDSGVTLGGLRFWGSPVTPYFFNWAFNRRSREIGRHWDLIPAGTDVLITHGPPFGLLDGVGPEREPVGCPQLARTVAAIKPRLHVFGHIHESYGSHHQGGTHYLNASICNAEYQVAQAPVVVELGSPVEHQGTAGTVSSHSRL